MSIRDSIKPIADKIQGFSLKIINPEIIINKIKTACENEINLRKDNSEFDSGVVYMASKILRILNDS